MTEQPQREYIINEQDLGILEDSFGVTLIGPRTRPTPSDDYTADLKLTIGMLEAEIDRIDESTTAIRNATLDEIPNVIRSDRECILRHEGFDYIRLIDVDVAIESLRTKEQP